MATKKKTNSKNKGSQGPDLLTVVVVLIAVVLVIVLISKYKKEKEGIEAGQPTGQAPVTEAVVPDTPTPEATQDVIAPTKAPEDVKDTPTPEVPTPTEEPVLSREEAENIVRKIIQLETYSVELLDDHLMIDGAEYYSFCINDGNGVAMEPLLIVEKKEGKLWCYDLSGVVATIEKFPLDKTETGNEGEKTFTVEEAKQLLASYSAERLGLAKDTASYEMTVDDWTTNANGVECYGINFFENVNGKQRFRGTFYVALDGSAVYGKDDVTGEFMER
ncbi:MAG: hypothetical protein E7268_06070 [Lachnospiraceae bacterium]|nr:hypothetical protein [Lachnospiraceae bacterium]